VSYTPIMIERVFILALFSCALVSGQVTSNSVTVNVSRNANLQPDQIVLDIEVSAGPAATLDQVLAALQGFGLTQANFSGLSSGPGQQVSWGFSLPVAFSDLKSTVAQLSALQTAIAQTNPGLSMSFSVRGTQVSQQSQQSVSCAAADLMADALARAQNMAAAAGQPLAGILSMSSASTAANPVSGIFSTPTYQPVCSLTATFALGAFQPPSTVAIAASRTLSLQPDQAVIVVSVNAGQSAALADIVAELQGSGIAAANLSNAFGPAGGIQWSFLLPVPFAQLPATLSTLAQLQQTLGGPKGQPNLTYLVQGTQVSQALQASQSCSFPALVTDAQSQAQKLASAAGVTLGPVVSVSDFPVSPVSVLQGEFGQIVAVGGVSQSTVFISLLPSIAPPPCALTVQFQLH
jgi:hypothetical protein